LSPGRARSAAVGTSVLSSSRLSSRPSCSTESRSTLHRQTRTNVSTCCAHSETRQASAARRGQDATTTTYPTAGGLPSSVSVAAPVQHITSSPLYSFVAVCREMSLPPGTTAYASIEPMSRLHCRRPQKIPLFLPRVLEPEYLRSSRRDRAKLP
jgi:hypothetical protein